MKNVLIFIGILVLIVILAAFTWLSYMGMFTKITVTEKELGPFTFAYVQHKGEYSKVGPDMNRVYVTLVNDYKITSVTGFAIYYDDPKSVQAADLRSDVGCLLEGTDRHKAGLVAKKLSIKQIGKKRYASAEFPMKNNLSYALGPIKVYPALSAYIQEKKYPVGLCIEVYTPKSIIYAFEIKK